MVSPLGHPALPIPRALAAAPLPDSDSEEDSAPPMLSPAAHQVSPASLLPLHAGDGDDPMTGPPTHRPALAAAPLPNSDSEEEDEPSNSISSAVQRSQQHAGGSRGGPAGRQQTRVPPGTLSSVMEVDEDTPSSSAPLQAAAPSSAPLQAAAPSRRPVASSSLDAAEDPDEVRASLQRLLGISFVPATATFGMIEVRCDYYCTAT
jgi:hypothetical protein